MSPIARFATIVGWMMFCALALMATKEAEAHLVGAGIVGTFGGFIIGIINCVMVENAQRSKTRTKGGE